MLHEEDEKELYEEMAAMDRELREKWNKAKEEVKALIHPKYFDFVESHEHYSGEGIVEIEETDERLSGYQNYKHCRIKNSDDKRLYMLHDGEVEMPYGKESQYEGESVEYWVWQETGHLGDDFYGYLLLPLNDGRYWKISYGC